MCGPYWSQWSHAELMSMQGVEIDEVDGSDEDVDGSDEQVGGRDCECSNCMECLGMSWSDFM